MADELNRIRKQIDTYDQELIRIFEKRLEDVLKIMQYKKDHKMPIFQPEREIQVLEKAAKNIRNVMLEEEAKEFIKEIMRISRRMQSKHLFPHNIVLVGFMGAGKSTVGKELSLLLEMECIDTDELIQNEEQMTIEALFERYGEKYFRNKEEKIIKKISKLKNNIISCGGGVVLCETNIINLKENGRVIYLETKPETIYSRIHKDTTRPLLKDHMALDNIEKKLEARKELYNKAADFTICTDNKMANEIAQEIITLLCR